MHWQTQSKKINVKYLFRKKAFKGMIELSQLNFMLNQLVQIQVVIFLFQNL